MFKLLVPRSSRIRYLLIAILAFTLGGTTVVEAAPTIALFRLADGTDSSKLAAVDASGNQQVKVNNFPASQAVSVGNFPATQAVSGTVTVGNTTANPAVVRETDNPALHAIQIYTTHVVDSDYTVNFVVYTVPAGKRLVIEHIDGKVDLSGTSVAQVIVSTYVNSQYAPHMITLNPAEFWDTIASRTFSEVVRLYADAGTNVLVEVTRPNVGSFALVPFNMSGYLIDVP